MTGDDYAGFLKLLGEAEPVPAANVAYVYPMALMLPEGADVEALERLLMAKLAALDGKDLDQAVQIVLLLAWRWKLPDLARQTFHRFAKAKGNATLALNWAIMASSASEESTDQLAILEDLALNVALSAPADFKPDSLSRSLSAVSNAAPQLAGALARAKFAAALAI